MDTTRFNEAMEAVRERLFILEEFPFIDRSRFPRGVREAAMAVREEELEAYAATLRGKELEALLHELLEVMSLEVTERIAAILSLRFSTRLVKLFFVLYQYYFDVDAIRLVLRRLTREARRRSQFPEAGQFFWKFCDTGDMFQEIKREFDSNWKTLDEFFEAYNIMKDTNLAMRIRLHCLEDTELPTIRTNLHHFLYVIQRVPEKQLLTAITNYIHLSDVKDGIKEVNTLILARMGEPSRSKKWEIYDRYVTGKFSEWCFYHHLEIHSMQHPKKYEVLSKYYDSIVQSYELEEAALVIDLGKVVVVDLPSEPYSSLYDKWRFEKEMQEWEEFGTRPAFYNVEKDRITARDYIIEYKEEPYMLLMYDGIDILYIRELLDLKIGLQPEIRKRIKNQ